MSHVITASKGARDLAYFERNRSYFRDNHFDVEELDLDGKKEDELRDILSKKELVYVEGGNTFYLLASIRRSGFEHVIKELLPKGLVYMGGSAGSYVACPSIETSTWKEKVRDRFGVTDFTAMNLLPFLLFVHYKPEEHQELLREKIHSTSHSVRILTDEQAIFIHDGKEEFLGGPEIVLS